ncbi:hypothetical protein ASPCAL04050 [Aspergillus calidoustus]|uniref:Uncharacterized protein n=1 Tax=Aspergillus calidoustus TaxID=454130 RepID=A0A0U5FW03_ASPCI|nr:hypothetical protein ASPCAL04050 [Aspergillus calidoustus]
MRASGGFLLSTSLLQLVLAQDPTNNATPTHPPNFTLLAPTPSAALLATDPITLRWAYTDTDLNTNPLTIEIGYTTSGTLEAHVTVNAAASLSLTTLPAGIITSVAPGETAAVGFVLNYRDGDYDDSEEVELGRVDGVSLLGGENEVVDEEDSKLSTEAKIGIGVGLGMGMSAAIFGVVFLIRRRRKRKRREMEKAAASEDQNGDEGSGNGGVKDPVEMEAVERGHGKAELGAESEKVELDAGGQQKAELDSGEQVKMVRLAELEEKPAVTTRYELAC